MIQAPILLVDIGRILFIGPVDEVPTHEAMVPVFGAGLDQEFELVFETKTTACRSTIVAANVNRAVRAHGHRLAVMPIDPVVTAERVLDEDRALTALMGLADGFDEGHWSALAAAIGLRPTNADFPPKLVRATEVISTNTDENLPAQDIADEVGLSVSRLQHLFQEHIGTTMRTYRIWRRFRAVMLSIKDGRSLTDAAIAAGFFDAAHFTNAFKRAFGVTPSFVFSPDLHIHVV